MSPVFAVLLLPRVDVQKACQCKKEGNGWPVRRWTRPTVRGAVSPGMFSRVSLVFMPCSGQFRSGHTCVPHLKILI